MINGDSNDYIVEEVLGSGTYGAVARCRIQGTEKVVALKIKSNSHYSSFYNETKILERLNELPQYSNHSIRFNDSFACQDFIYQEFELLDKDLCEFLENKGGPLKVAEVRVIAQQILVALSALKQLGITHTDIKVDNIMLVNHEAQPFRVKLIDFGLTERLPQKSIIQTLPYRAPEITLGLPRDEAIDTWSLGCLLSNLFRGHKGTLSEHSWRFKSLEQYQMKKGKVYRNIKAFLDLVKKMLTVDPANRILPDDALKHPFITMEHLDRSSDKNYVRNAHELMRNVQPGVQTDIDRLLFKSYVKNICELKKIMQSGNIPSSSEIEITKVITNLFTVVAPKMNKSAHSKKIAGSGFTWDFSCVVNTFSQCMRGFSLGAPVPPTNTKNIAG
uniref:Protein kinase domain-containing protein n=1 Tax=Nothobranchius furzeri TaxID=105023 RepID=A0A8C6M8C8_NOTFU